MFSFEEMPDIEMGFPAHPTFSRFNRLVSLVALAQGCPETDFAWLYFPSLCIRKFKNPNQIGACDVGYLFNSYFPPDSTVGQPISDPVTSSVISPAQSPVLRESPFPGIPLPTLPSYLQK